MRTSLPSALLLSSSFLDRHVAKQLPRSRSRRLLASTGGGAGGQIKVEDIAKSFREGTYKRVLVVSGAGVSCSAGIPDFRTPGSGLYSNLNAYSLPYPEGMSCPPRNHQHQNPINNQSLNSAKQYSNSTFSAKIHSRLSLSPRRFGQVSSTGRRSHTVSSRCSIGRDYSKDSTRKLKYDAPV